MCAIATSPSTSALSSGSISSFVDVKFPEQPEDVKPIVNPTDFINGIGDYLLRVAVLQSHLTERLIQDPQINRFIVEAHQQSHKKTDTADLSSIVAFDIQLGRLWYGTAMHLLLLHETNARRTVKFVIWRPSSPVTYKKYGTLENWNYQRLRPSTLHFPHYFIPTLDRKRCP
jgi:hypothetical protein